MESISYPQMASKFSSKYLSKWARQLEILDIALSHVTKWGTAIDGGAYVGTWSVRMLERFDRVVAFEPLDPNLECLRINAPGAEIIPLALSDVPGIELCEVKGAGFAHLGRGANKVQCTTLDSYSYDDLGLIKLDVEGHERQALAGAVETIQKHRPVIIAEMKYEKPELESALEMMGYRKVAESKIDAVWV